MTIPSENSQLTKLHSACMDSINEHLIVLQDETADLYKKALSLAEKELETLRDLESAVERSGLDICWCKTCGKKVVVIPDGLPMCEPCSEKEAAR